jgi:2-polyprenyl-3-methyl-5-hydroxy-6-metoxy-1,4-benzoquinol methylase
MDQRLREEILQANITLHKDEAALYDRIHPELTNKDERDRLSRLLDLATQDSPDNKKRRALDLGTGTGFVSSELLTRGFEVDAVDISEEMIERLRAKQPEALASGKLHTVVQDADSFLKSQATSYDVITASSVLHHFPDYGETIKEMVAHLKPGGSLVFFHEPSSGKTSFIELFLRRIDWKLSRLFLVSQEDLATMKQLNLQYEMADYHVTHGFDEHTVQATLKAAGLEVVALERYATAQTGLIRSIFSIFFPPRTWSLVAKPKA